MGLNDDEESKLLRDVYSDLRETGLCLTCNSNVSIEDYLECVSCIEERVTQLFNEIPIPHYYD